MHDLWRKILGASAARFYSRAISLTTLAITARFLGPAGRGTIAAVTTWTTLF
ncbi:MAG: lipopolysaccharide biosynthesis protein, partial [Chthonomonadaceae bacterium]|nr:lipopolysaccharide biosynthesis protein [Chthonomonadaceae bacterium]